MSQEMFFQIKRVLRLRHAAQSLLLDTYDSVLGVDTSEVLGLVR